MNDKNETVPECPNCHNTTMNIAHNFGVPSFDGEGYIKLYCDDATCEDRMIVVSAKYVKWSRNNSIK